MHYDLTDLKLFAAIADAGNVSRGGAACFLAPSSASLRIKQLEETLGTQLFTREARGVSLTRAGQVMLEHCRRCLAGLEQMHADLAPYANGIKAQVTLFASSSALASFVPQDLQGFLVQFPEVRVTVEERLSHETIAAVVNGRADIGIVTWNDTHPALSFMPYRQNELMVVVHPDDALAHQDKITFAECLQRPFISMNSSAAIHTYLMNQAAAMRLQLDVRIQVSSFASVLSLVRTGAGIGLVPRPVLQSLNAEGVCVLPLDETWAIRPLTICIREAHEAATPYLNSLLNCFLTASGHAARPSSH